MSPLALLNEGERAEIIAHHPGHERTRAHRDGHGPCRGQCPHCPCRAAKAGTSTENHDRLQKMGLRPGKSVEMITNSGTGPIVLRVDESRIALGRLAAMKIYVRRDKA